MPSLRDDLAFLDRALIELHIDRGFVASQVVREIVDRGGLVLCKSWVPNNGDLYSRADFNLQQKLRKLAASPAGRERLRERVGIEHSLAHMARRQGPSARHCGIRKNLFDARRTAAVQNLEPIQREAA